MKMSPHALVSTLLLAGMLLLTATPLAAQNGTPAPEGSPLASFDRLVGGTWRLDDAYQIFEWGVGKKVLRAKSYRIVEGEAKLVSEGFWFWHPGEQIVRGYSVAIDMPVETFDYITVFDGDSIISTLTSYDADGNAQQFLETWEFTDDNTYLWTLYDQTPEGSVKTMEGTFTRE